VSLANLYRTHVPSWAQDPEEGAPLLYTFGKLADAVKDHARDGLSARFPLGATRAGQTPKPPARDALSLIARDRGIEWGIDESPEAFGLRLIPWLDDHARRGNPFMLMKQIRGYCNADVRVRTVDCRGNWFTRERDGSESWLLNQGNWDWDGVTNRRFWVIIYPTSDGRPWTTGGTWGDGSTWGEPGRTWGTTATSTHVATVRRIVQFWKPAGTQCSHIIIAFDDDSLHPTDSEDLPAGNWNRAVNRLRSARYWRGTRAAA
jgi:hypothetical protein